MSVSLDWATIAAILGSPLSTPWSTIVNVFLGFALTAYVVVPAMYATNLYNSQRYPFISNKLYKSDGHRYKVSEVSVMEQACSLEFRLTFHFSAFAAEFSACFLFIFVLQTYSQVSQFHLIPGQKGKLLSDR